MVSLLIGTLKNKHDLIITTGIVSFYLPLVQQPRQLPKKFFKESLIYFFGKRILMTFDPKREIFLLKCIILSKFLLI